MDFQISKIVTKKITVFYELLSLRWPVTAVPSELTQAPTLSLGTVIPKEGFVDADNLLHLLVLINIQIVEVKMFET